MAHSYFMLMIKKKVDNSWKKNEKNSSYIYLCLQLLASESYPTAEFLVPAALKGLVAAIASYA